MASLPNSKRVTYEEWLRLPEVSDAREEVVNGEIRIMPEPKWKPHRIIELTRRALELQMDTDRFSFAQAGFNLIIRKSPLTTRVPDLAIFDLSTIIDQDGFIHSPPQLLVEVLSPANTRREREEKLNDYAAIAVPEVWVISPEARTVEVLYFENEYLRSAQILNAGTLTPKLFPNVTVDIAPHLARLMRFVLLVLIATAAFCQTPLHYTCRRAPSPIQIDGKLDDPAWQSAEWTADFIDIQGASHPAPRYRTRAKMLWDDQYFYIAAELEEPHVWATLTGHDAVIFRDNDFEVFLNPSGDTLNYFEFEINALNTGWDLFLNKPYRHGGKADNSWEIPGLLTAVHVDGTLNDSRDRDRGWTVEIAFPWSAFASRAPVKRPAPGDEWRVNFSRVEWLTDIVDGKYVKVAGKPEDNWVWSPQGLIDMHVPEHWGYVHFAAR